LIYWSLKALELLVFFELSVQFAAKYFAIKLTENKLNFVDLIIEKY